MLTMLDLKMRPYKHAVKHTRRSFRRALKKAVNDSQKKLWIMAGIAAEEFVLTLLQHYPKFNLKIFQDRILSKDVEANKLLLVWHAYLSSLVVSVSMDKMTLLQSTAMTEQNFLQSWCWVFEYTQEDIKLFDEALLPALHHKGQIGLVQKLGQMIVENLYQDKHELTQEEMTILEEIVLKDVSGIIQYLQQAS